MDYEVVVYYRYAHDEKRRWFDQGSFRVHSKVFAEYFATLISGQVGYKAEVRESDRLKRHLESVNMEVTNES